MKRKWLAVGIILLFVGTCIIPAMAQNIEKPSSTSRGNWLYVGGSGPGNYTKIQDAINDSSDGDIVFVYAGVYMENVNIHKSMTLLGENRETTIIDANGSNSPIFIEFSYVSISGFTVRNSGDRVDDAGISLLLGTHNSITDNKIINNGNGVYFLYSENNTVLNNIITESRGGLGFWGCGIWMCYSDFNQIENNIIKNNTVGIHIQDSSQINMIKNYIDGNRNGVIVTQGGSCNISLNTISNSSRMGRFGGGLAFIYCTNNKVYSNNFIENEKDVGFIYFRSAVPTKNIFLHNYWDKHRGAHPKPILGRLILLSFSALIPIEVFIPWLNFDWYPAQEPYDIVR